jgi:hypothetical protein
MYDAYLRYANARDEGKETFLIYLGDHDPSGLDMTRDIEDRMGRFLHFTGYFIDEPIPYENVLRVALNMDQVDQYKPPENPAKLTDSRAKEYIQKHGGKSWELDALDPSILRQIVELSIKMFVDEDKFNEVAQREKAIKGKMKTMAEEMKDGDAG